MKLTLFYALLILSVVSCNVKEPKDYDTDQALFGKAQKLYERKNYADALPFYEELRTRFPMSPYLTETELKIGEAYFNKSDYLEAEMALQSFRTLHPTHPQTPYATFLLGQTHDKRVPKSPSRDQTQAKHAVRVFSELLRKHPDSPYQTESEKLLQKNKDKLLEKDLMVGNYYLKRKKYDAAISRLNEVLQSDASEKIKTQAKYKKALAFYKSGRKNDAKEILNELAVSDPKNKAAQSLLKKIK